MQCSSGVRTLLLRQQGAVEPGCAVLFDMAYAQCVHWPANTAAAGFVSVAATGACTLVLQSPTISH